MPDWPRCLREIAAVGAMSIVLGGVGTVASVWWCLSSVDGRQLDMQQPELPQDVGPFPETVRLHVRAGIFWLVARDQLPGVYWVNLERVAEPSINPELTLALVPSWADAPLAMQGRSVQGPVARVGTLAVGWPFLAVARQWVEPDPTQGFIPLVENDDDGSSTAKAAARFFTASPDSRAVVIPLGAIGDVLAFAAVAAPLVAISRGFMRRRADRLNRPASAA